MKGKQDGTKAGKIKQLLAASSVDPFIGSRQPLPLIGQSGSSLSSHMNIHVHREALTELSHGGRGGGVTKKPAASPAAARTEDGLYSSWGRERA